MWAGRLKFVSAAICGLTLFVASQAQAGFTTINPARPSEDGIAKILSTVYGGTFSANGLNFSNGSITATRIDDDLDKSFTTEGKISARAIALFSKMPQNFGYWAGADAGGTYTKLFDATGTQYALTGEVTDVTVAAALRFGRGGNTALYSSNPEDGTDTLKRDHQVTYKLTGPTFGEGTILAFFEDDDRTGPNTADFDFQDLVVEIRGISGGTVIPLPAAVLPGLLTLAGAAGVSAVRKFRRKIA